MTGEGSASGWRCPNCGRFLYKPPRVYEGARYHSNRCKSPMQPATIFWSAP